MGSPFYNLQHKKEKGILIRFPGREEVEEKFPSIREHGSIDGRLVRIGGSMNLYI
jgi:hypothetical protein